MDRQNRAGVTSVAMSAAVRGYQLLVSPLLPPACRFLPTCSEYAAEAIERHGSWRGIILASRRLGLPTCRLGPVANFARFFIPIPRNGTTQSPHRDRALGRDPDRFSVRVRAHPADATFRPVGRDRSDGAGEDGSGIPIGGSLSRGFGQYSRRL